MLITYIGRNSIKQKKTFQVLETERFKYLSWINTYFPVFNLVNSW